ncbi:hypothetical protein GQX73_g10430 [Xylaria multiplex]|uniref:Uncharacterized protein n=1 Tax=Xylaria multiplex TaxID=323545 RepID=A0A7C8MI95_9PEZI|nr:hypothetical protein GQX73_g10430 [Xylaria multiplex]
MKVRQIQQKPKLQPDNQTDSTDRFSAIIHHASNPPQAPLAAPLRQNREGECVFSSAVSIFGHYTLLDAVDMNGIDRFSTAAVNMPLTPSSETPWLTNESTSTSHESGGFGSVVINPGKVRASPNGNEVPSTDLILANGQQGDSYGWQSPLHLAAQKGDDRIVRVLLQYQSDCNERDSDGLTPLFHAIISGHEDVASLLLEHGARIGEKDWQGRTALALAVIYRREALLETLLQKCAGDQALIDGYNATGQAPLHVAIDIGFEAGVRLLLEHGANLTSTRKIP